MMSAVLWGMVFGAAAGLSLLGAGRIAGVSGILAGLLDIQRSDRGWRVAFVAGLLLSGLVAMRFVPEHLPLGKASFSPALAAGALLLGVGARLSNGCTSGHAVCGVGRLSARSIVATLTFCATGAISVLVTHLMQGGVR